ncbi:MAG: transposase [Elusimicrobia bacterium]|nr:transposase [Elusimicrobiota bacterium]
MKRGGPQKYPKEVIRAAIQKMENGASLSSIARELGLSKTTVKYWLDNAPKFLAKDSGKGFGVGQGRVQAKISVYGWALLFKIYRQIGRSMEQASFKDLVYALSELHKSLPQLTPMTGNGVPSRILEMKEETRVTVKEYLDKQKRAQEAPIDAVEIRRETSAPEARPPAALPASGEAPAEEEGGGNDAKE